MRLRLLSAVLFAMTSAASAAELPSTVVLKLGHSLTGSWGMVGRVVADHLGKHLPGQPAIELESVDGGNGVLLVRQLVESEARDGSIFSMFILNVIQGYVIDPSAYEFKPTGLSWVGSLASTVTLCVKSAGSDVSLTSDTLILGATAKTGPFYALGAIVRHLVNKDINIIVGFDTENELMAALDRGEIDAYCGVTYSTYKREGREATQVVLGGIGNPERLAALGVEDLTASASDADRELVTLAMAPYYHFYGIALPAGTDAETVGIYREAFARMNEDPAFLEEIRAKVIEYSAAPGEEVQAAVDALLATDPAVVARYAEVLQ